MSEWICASFGMAGLFLFLAMIFFVLKEKACVLISGYNFKTKEERKNYDEKRMSRENVVFWFLCSAIFIIGGAGCILISDDCFWGALTIWLVYFFAHAGFSDKVFDKYKKD